MTNLTKHYDLIITNITMDHWHFTCPLIAINTYPTNKDYERIQQFINQYEPLTSRKDYRNELTPST
ncbi:PTS sugar transporter subunit IIB [Enterococcus hermanniensis]